MGWFRTRSGRCVVEHGEVRLESIGFRGRFQRGYQKAKRAHKQRYDRSVIRFGFVLFLAMYGLGQFLNVVLFGNRNLALFGVAIGVGLLTLIYGYFLLRRVVRRLFRGFTSKQTIPIRAIESVDSRPKRLFREPHFVIHYDENGVERKRYIGVFPAEEEFEEAKVLFFDEHGLSIAGP